LARSTPGGCTGIIRNRALLYASLPPPARDFWTNRAQRRQLLGTLLAEWEPLTEAYIPYVTQIDDYVADLLAGVGLPRGEIRGIAIDWDLLDAHGAKTPSCLIRLGATYLSEALTEWDSPDEVMRTWIHESLHARQPFASHYRSELGPHKGYEEGLVIGLADAIARGLLGLEIEAAEEEHYARAYRALAAVIKCDPVDLWAGLWQWPTGAIRGHFVDFLGTLWQTQAGQPLGSREREKLQPVADHLFGSYAAPRDLAEPQLMTMWQEALA
jgi:hypothetical protein